MELQEELDKSARQKDSKLQKFLKTKPIREHLVERNSEVLNLIQKQTPEMAVK